MNPALKQQDRFTYADYSRWPQEERWELIYGQAYAMTAPSRLHQDIVFELGRQIGNYLQGKSCKGYVAPFDVRLPEAAGKSDGDTGTVVQPDIAVICDTAKLDDKGCRGAPDWIIEVLSPATALKDMETKRRLYEAHGVREYWLVHPAEKWLMIYTLSGQGRYETMRMFALAETVAVSVLDGLEIDWSFIENA